MLKLIRRNPLINKAGRNTILMAHDFVSFLEKKWKLSGIVEIELNGCRFRMFSKCDDGILKPLFYNDSYVELSDLRVFTNLIGEKSVILDIGANTGIYSIASAAMSGGSQIYSFEPNPVNYRRLLKNIEINSFTNITTFQQAVGAFKGAIGFTVPEKDMISDTSSALESFSKSTYSGDIEWKNIEAEQIMLDDFCSDLTLDKVDLIKIDVEGYELSVLKGASKLIERFRPTILIESFLNEEKRKYLEDLVVSNNYTIYLIIKEGIIKTGKELEENIGLNYLLMSHETKGVFTKMADLKTIRDNV